MSKLLRAFARYRKTLTSFTGSTLAWVGVAYIPDGHITRTEWYALAVAWAGVAGVYAVANEPLTDGPVSL